MFLGGERQNLQFQSTFNLRGTITLIKHTCADCRPLIRHGGALLANLVCLKVHQVSEWKILNTGDIQPSQTKVLLALFTWSLSISMNGKWPSQRLKGLQKKYPTLHTSSFRLSFLNAMACGSCTTIAWHILCSYTFISYYCMLFSAAAAPCTLKSRHCLIRAYLVRHSANCPNA